jgi:hypothetical protein
MVGGRGYRYIDPSKTKIRCANYTMAQTIGRRWPWPEYEIIESNQYSKASQEILGTEANTRQIQRSTKKAECEGWDKGCDKLLKTPSSCATCSNAAIADSSSDGIFCGLGGSPSSEWRFNANLDRLLEVEKGQGAIRWSDYSTNKGCLRRFCWQARGSNLQRSKFNSVEENKYPRTFSSQVKRRSIAE